MRNHEPQHHSRRAAPLDFGYELSDEDLEQVTGGLDRVKLDDETTHLPPNPADIDDVVLGDLQ